MFCKKLSLGVIMMLMMFTSSQMFASCGITETNHDSEQKPDKTETEDTSKDKYVILLVAGEYYLTNSFKTFAQAT